MYEFKEYISRNKSMDEVTYDGYAGTFCPKCCAPFVFKTAYNFTQTTYGNSNIVSGTNMDRLIGYHIRKCPRCNTKNIYTDILLDPNIAESIALLNSKGYTTTDSCEGHKIYGINHISSAYVAFADMKVLNVFKLFPPPEIWEIEINKYMDRPVIRARDDENGKSYIDPIVVQYRMDLLREWVELLPEMK